MPIQDVEGGFRLTFKPGVDLSTLEGGDPTLWFTDNARDPYSGQYGASDQHGASDRYGADTSGIYPQPFSLLHTSSHQPDSLYSHVSVLMHNRRN